MNEIGMPVDGQERRKGAGQGWKMSTRGGERTSRKRERVKEVVRIRREGGVRATWLI